jgi:hypothetical protein
MNENDKKLLVLIPKELHTRAKMQAVRSGKPLREVVEKLLAEWTAKQEQKPQQKK